MTIVVDMPIEEEHRRMLDEAAGTDEIFYCENDEIPADILARCAILIGRPSLDTLRRAENVRLVQIHSAGVGEYLRLKEIRPEARLCCATGCYGTAISEHMLGVLLMMMKKLALYRDSQFDGAWRSRGFVDAIEGAKVLSVGMGDIGSTFAEKMHALGAEVIGVRRSPAEAPSYVKAVYPVSELDRLLPGADVVALSMPETPETAGLMDERRLSLMKPGAYLINVGRGSAVDQDALVKALREGRLAGAALDVTSPEPLPAEHPLWKEPGCVLTPHISGGFRLPLTLKKIITLACANIRAYRDGLPLISEVDFERGYSRRAER